MDDVVEVTLPGETRQVPFGTPIVQLLGGTGKAAPLAAIMNGETVGLAKRITEPVTITPLYLADRSGYAVYARSVAFLLVLAVRETWPDATLEVDHAINNEIAAAITNGHTLTDADVRRVRDTMRDLVARDLPIERVKVKRDEAISIFEASGMTDKLEVMRHANRTYLTLYRCLDLYDYLYGALVPSTGYLHTFDLVPFDGGVLLLLPEKRPPHAQTTVTTMPKLRAVFDETETWARILGTANVGEINAAIEADGGRDLVLVSEALHEKKISQIADAILADLARTRLVLIAGPSSSGKTTFSKRLSIQLRVLGLEPFTISADDYFLDRDRSPVDAQGRHDFESLAALDVEKLDGDLARVLRGDQIDLVRFDFVAGKRVPTGRRYALREKSILVVEGIHGLNDGMTPSIPASGKYRIYASALNALNLDNHTSIFVSDVRTLRRMVRDSRTRGANADKTLTMWPSVRSGEERNIFPFQEQADVMFNSSLLYELSVLKPHAQPLLELVDRDSPVYGEAMRMLEFLSFFAPLGESYIPPNSIVREFIGDSCFE